MRKFFFSRKSQIYKTLTIQIYHFSEIFLNILPEFPYFPKFSIKKKQDFLKFKVIAKQEISLFVFTN